MEKNPLEHMEDDLFAVFDAPPPVAKAKPAPAAAAAKTAAHVPAAAEQHTESVVQCVGFRFLKNS
jgi:hypothetical protein